MLNYRLIRLKHTGLRLAAFFACVAALLGVEPRGAGAVLSVTEPDGSEVVSESADYAIQRFADPWDMTQRTDLSHGQYMNQLRNVKFRNGVFSARTTGTDAQGEDLPRGQRLERLRCRHHHQGRLDRQTDGLAFRSDQ